MILVVSYPGEEHTDAVCARLAAAGEPVHRLNLADFPARLPLVQLDHVYVRGLEPIGLQVPRGRIWWRMSDHLPLIAEFRL